ncbi:MAG TPA: CapA family protein, partial [Polyangia bacterium]|nr:CapA family protein [Polyangia bacterium]
NHAAVYGRDGLVDTLANVAAAGLLPLGAGRDASDARRGVIVDVGGIRVGLLAYCDHDFLWNVWVDQFAHRHHPGVAAAFDRAVREDIARLRKQAQLVVVSFHMGDNYAPPTPATIAWSRRAIDLGADLVVNHHPHVAHPLMMWHKKPIVLSLGNYAFGTEARPSLDYGMLAVAHARRCGNGSAAFDRVEIVPLAVQNRRVNYRPEPLHDAELDAFIARLVRDSAPFGAALETDAGRAVLPLGGCS